MTRFRREKATKRVIITKKKPPRRNINNMDSVIQVSEWLQSDHNIIQNNSIKLSPSKTKLQEQFERRRKELRQINQTYLKTNLADLKKLQGFTKKQKFQSTMKLHSKKMFLHTDRTRSVHTLTSFAQIKHRDFNPQKLNNERIISL